MGERRCGEWREYEGRKEEGKEGKRRGLEKGVQMLHFGFVTAKRHIMCAEPRLFDVLCVNACGASWL